ncbi:lysostaphin resistance A-like protein [Haloferula sp.]|uniref:CPBP family intramembrane glutamic endopeptidase n=1 Tax=Haloferula sp. TaxID=2497595 RepID=UPI003C77825B
MPKDVGFWIVMSAVILAGVVFVVGWLRQRLLVAQNPAPDAFQDLVVPPPLSGPMTSGWWRISTVIYNRWDLVLMASVCGFYLLPLILEIFVGKNEMGEMTIGMAVMTIGIQLFMMAFVIGFVAWRMQPTRWLGLRWPMWPLVFPISIVGVLFTWGVLGVLQAVGFFEWLQTEMGNDGKQEVVKAFAEIEDPLTLGLMVVMAAVVAPLTEEVLFRGYVYPVAKRYIGRWAAIIFGALIFAAIHNNAQALIPLFVLAVLLTLAYEFTGSIWAPIGIHALFNAATVGAQLAIRYGLIEDPGL